MRRRLIFIILCCVLTGAFVACDSDTSTNPHPADTGSGPVDDVGDDADEGAPIVDSDNDGVADAEDTCPNLPNPGQEDGDRDSIGDACDNCPGVANRDQRDQNEDGRGDECEEPIDPDGDEDGDEVSNATDNCPYHPNPAQSDSDNDQIGDECDNCPLTANVDQLDVDDDGEGDACPPREYDPAQDSDGDGVRDVEDGCPRLANPDQEDLDDDGVGDGCDNCPATENFPQDDLDANGIGDACEIPPDETTFGTSTDVGASIIKPVLHFLLDTSGSMMGGRLIVLKSALDDLALRTNLLSNFLVGIAHFGGCEVTELLEAQEDLTIWSFRSRYRDLNAAGATPTGPAIDAVHINQWVDIDGEPPPNRERRIVLITDGEPTDVCDAETTLSSQEYAVNRAADSLHRKTPVYVVGFDNLPSTAQDNMQAMAVAGGTDNPNHETRNWFEVSSTDTSELTAALEAITAISTSCDVQLYPATGDDPTRIRVSIVDGDETILVSPGAPNGWVLTRATLVVSLLGESCARLRQAVAGAGSGVVNGAKVELASLTCTPEAEVCDFVDNDCNRVVDEGCDCFPEVCDGSDNDCDDEVDEGC